MLFINLNFKFKFKCNGPLPRAGSSASSTWVLTLWVFGDGPVLTGVFPFFSVSRFPDGIATIKRNKQ
ncbi:hypothetical protein T03_10761 [Trichinella britovi]|uniref:Uncharacterized protein n=1 Tax=Trichinella britovi TaxID=45882 RepID=A0A0V1D0N6_TRIBR|nr:hypothetical protein T03_10761 [Trichinella britovi]